MQPAAQFLTSLAKVMSTLTLYEEGHPARERAIDGVYETLVRLQEDDPYVVFTFLADEIVFMNRPLRELSHSDWGSRLANAGVQRLEFLDHVTKEDFEAFLDEIYVRVSGEAVSTAEVRQGRPSNIRYGTVGLRGKSTPAAADAAEDAVETARTGYSLREEIESVEWMHGELKDARQLKMLEAEATVRSLSVAMHGDQAYMIPLLRIKDFDQYTVTHTLNVSVLTMALAEYLGLSDKEVRAFGIAGLLHDLGKVKVPDEILNKPGKLTDEERAVMSNHTIEGARIIMETEEHLDLAAVVAYEHHIKIDGGGYPKVRYQRQCHQASNLVHVCDVFDALRTHRPYREAWPAERALSIIEEGAGPEFDKDIAHAFIQMMTKWEGQITEVSTENPEVQYADDGEGGAQGAGADTRGQESGSGDDAKPPLESPEGAQPHPDESSPESGQESS
jgi:putative nucleotidyltransferase with HDIG domain